MKQIKRIGSTKIKYLLRVQIHSLTINLKESSEIKVALKRRNKLIESEPVLYEMPTKPLMFESSLPIEVSMYQKDSKFMPKNVEFVILKVTGKKPAKIGKGELEFSKIAQNGEAIINQVVQIKGSEDKQASLLISADLTLVRNQTAMSFSVGDMKLNDLDSDFLVYGSPKAQKKKLFRSTISGGQKEDDYNRREAIYSAPLSLSKIITEIKEENEEGEEKVEQIQQKQGKSEEVKQMQKEEIKEEKIEEKIEEKKDEKQEEKKEEKKEEKIESKTVEIKEEKKETRLEIKEKKEEKEERNENRNEQRNEDKKIEINEMIQKDVKEFEKRELGYAALESPQEQVDTANNQNDKINLVISENPKANQNEALDENEDTYSIDDIMNEVDEDYDYRKIDIASFSNSPFKEILLGPMDYKRDPQFELIEQDEKKRQSPVLKGSTKDLELKPQKGKLRGYSDDYCDKNSDSDSSSSDEEPVFVNSEIITAPIPSKAMDEVPPNQQSKKELIKAKESESKINGRRGYCVKCIVF